jgi:formate dehydrogenase subunit delta
MDPTHLIRMANRIGEFFETMPDREQGLEGVANHLDKFWEPAMRGALLAWIDAHPAGHAGKLELKPIVLHAIGAYRERLNPA